MANYYLVCNEVVSARTQFLTPGGDPSTFRSVTSVRRNTEVASVLEAQAKGQGFLRRGSDSPTALDAGHSVESGKGYHAHGVVSTHDTGSVRVTYVIRHGDSVVARETAEAAHIFDIRHSDTVSTVDSGTGRKQFWAQCAETLSAIDSLTLTGDWTQRCQDVVSAMDSVRVQIRQRPGVGLTLHPDQNGTYQDWLCDPSSNAAYQNVQEHVPDNAATIVYLNSEPGEAVTFTLPPILNPVACPQHIAGITVRLVAQGSGASLRPRFVLRGRVYDGDTFDLDGTWKSYYFWWPINVFGNRPWTSTALLDLEVGVVNAGTAPVALTTVTVFVATEPTPFRYPVLSAGGSRQEWVVHPPEGTDFDAVRQEDGGRSYLFTSSALVAPSSFNVYNNLDGKVLYYSLGGATHHLMFDGQGHNPINFDAIISQLQAAGLNAFRANVFGEVMATGAYLAISDALLTLIYSGSTAWTDLGFDGTSDLSPLYGQRHTIRSTDSDVWIPDEFRVNKVNLVVRAAGAGILTPLVLDDGFEHQGPFGKWPLVLSSDRQTFTVPFYHRPSFTSGSSRWDLPAILAAEWGVKNEAAAEATVDYERLDVFSSLVPEEELRFAPLSDGTWSDWTIGAPNAGESAYEDVNSYLPDDASYLTATASFGTPKICTFPIERSLEANWYGLRWRIRIGQSSGYTSGISFAPILVLPTDHYVGRLFHMYNTGFNEVVEDFWVNPITGKPWAATDLQGIEMGIILYEGQADLSWCVADVGVVPPREHSASSLLCSFTTVGLANVARAISDSLVWKIDRYQVGRGGYQRDNPAVTHPIEPSDLTLEDPIYTGKVLKASFVAKTAYYWIAVPPDALSDPIGEIMLMARVISSSNPSDIVGSYFPMAVVHFPAGFHTMRSIRVLKLALQYNV